PVDDSQIADMEMARSLLVRCLGIFEHMKSTRCTQESKDNAQSRPREACLGEGTLKEVPHPQRVGPVTHIGQIERGPLSTHDAEYVIPLASGGAPAHLKPLQLRQDRILRRRYAYRVCACL